MNYPVVLFAYNRPRHVARLLEQLRGEGIDTLIAYADGPRTPADAPAVAEVRALLRTIDWCDCRLHDRAENLGLGPSILTGMTEVFAEREAALVFEDDMVIAPGTCAYLNAALTHYRDDPRVMSVTGWTLPSVTPSEVVDQPYFDGRAESWVWGSWARAWEGMDDGTALEKLERCIERGIDPAAYGADLPAMAQMELPRRLWAVRFLYHHILNDGLCMRPPRSLVNHGGNDGTGTNFGNGGAYWTNRQLWTPVLPRSWPEPLEHPEVAGRWRALIVNPPPPPPPGLLDRLRGIKHRLVRRYRTP